MPRLFTHIEQLIYDLRLKQVRQLRYIIPAICLIFGSFSLNAQTHDAQTQQKVEYFFYQALRARDAGNFAEAFDFLRFCYALDPTNPDVLAELGLFFGLLGEERYALELFRRAVYFDPSNYHFNIALAEMNLHFGYVQEALDIYNLLLELYPERMEILMDLAYLFAEEGEWQQAIDVLNVLESHVGIVEEITMYKVHHYLRMGMRDQARDEVRRISEEYPYDPRFLILIGTLYADENQNDKALTYFEKAREVAPEFPPLLLTLARFYEQLLRLAVENDDTEWGIAIATEALKHVPQELRFYFFLGSVKFDEGDYQGALDIFRRSIEYAHFPSPALKSMVLGQMGDLFHLLDDMESAFAHYAKALEYDQANLHVLNNYAYFLALERRDLYRAEQMSAFTIRAEPTNPTFLDTYGWVLFQQGAYSLARAYLERAMRYSADEPNATISEQYGDVLYRTGNPERALEMWIKARELGGDSEELMRKIETGSLEGIGNRE